MRMGVRVLKIGRIPQSLLSDLVRSSVNGTFEPLSNQVPETLHKASEGANSELNAISPPGAVDFLLQFKSLKDVVLVGYHYEFSLSHSGWSLPVFSNLRTLGLFGLDRHALLSMRGSTKGIITTLLSSPALRSLGLSLSESNGNVDTLTLKNLVRKYVMKRKSLNKPLLRLSELHLGLGFLPKSDQEDDYLAGFTDLTALTTLRLDNWRKGPGWGRHGFRIQPTLFLKATQVRNISVEVFDKHILQLIHLLKESNSGQGSLNGIEVSRFFDAQVINEANFEDEAMHVQQYCQDLSSAGFHWRKIAFGEDLQNKLIYEEMPKTGEPLATCILKDFVDGCVDVEELSIPMSRADLDYFLAQVMLRMRKLHTLKLFTKSVSDLQPSSGYLDVAAEPIFKTREELAEGFNERPQEIEKSRKEIAAEMLARNRQLVRSNADTAILRYVGINDHLYCCMVAIPPGMVQADMLSVEVKNNDGTETEDFYIVELSKDRARDLNRSLFLNH